MMGQKVSAVSRGLVAGGERGRGAELSSLLEEWALLDQTSMSLKTTASEPAANKPFFI